MAIDIGASSGRHIVGFEKDGKTAHLKRINTISDEQLKIIANASGVHYKDG